MIWQLLIMKCVGSCASPCLSLMTSTRRCDNSGLFFHTFSMLMINNDFFSQTISKISCSPHCSCKTSFFLSKSIFMNCHACRHGAAFMHQCASRNCSMALTERGSLIVKYSDGALARILTKLRKRRKTIKKLHCWFEPFCAPFSVFPFRTSRAWTFKWAGDLPMQLDSRVMRLRVWHRFRIGGHNEKREVTRQITIYCECFWGFAL